MNLPTFFRINKGNGLLTGAQIKIYIYHISSLTYLFYSYRENNPRNHFNFDYL